MPSKPGRPPVSTSIKKGQTLALGNDKTTKLSTWLEKEMSKKAKVPTTLAEYEEAMTNAQYLAARVVDGTLAAESLKELLDGASFIADRTEGKPQQPIKHSGDDEHPVTVQIFKPEKYED